MLMLKVHIARLWQKLGDDAHNPRYIFAERGLGYRFVRPATVSPSPYSSAQGLVYSVDRSVTILLPSVTGAVTYFV